MPKLRHTESRFLVLRRELCDSGLVNARPCVHAPHGQMLRGGGRVPSVGLTHAKLSRSEAAFLSPRLSPRRSLSPFSIRVRATGKGRARVFRCMCCWTERSCSPYIYGGTSPLGGRARTARWKGFVRKFFDAGAAREEYLSRDAVTPLRPSALFPYVRHARVDYIHGFDSWEAG